MSKKKPKRGNRQAHTHRRIILIGIAFLIGGIALLKALPKPEQSKTSRYRTKPIAPPSTSKKTIAKKELPPLPLTLPKIPPARVAILIDDLGKDETVAQSLVQMDFPLTMSILPSQPHSFAIAQLAKNYQREVLLHLPMEPHGVWKDKMYADILLTDMDQETLIKKTKAYLDELPDIVGVNNHMGSKFTESPDGMRPILKLLKEKGLLFVDSRTSKNSVAYKLAKEMGLKASQRKIFLDNDQTEEAIVEQIMKLGELAQSTEGRNGVIAIGHPYPSTISALIKTLPKLKDSGIEIVPVSQLVN